MKNRLQLVRLASAILIGSMLVCAVSCGIGIVSGQGVFLAVGLSPSSSVYGRGSPSP